MEGSFFQQSIQPNYWGPRQLYSITPKIYHFHVMTSNSSRMHLWYWFLLNPAPENNNSSARTLLSSSWAVHIVNMYQSNWEANCLSQALLDSHPPCCVGTCIWCSSFTSRNNLIGPSKFLKYSNCDIPWYHPQLRQYLTYSTPAFPFSSPCET